MNYFFPRSYYLTRLCIQRALAFIYLIGFLIAVHQYLPLLGHDGLYPVRIFLTRISFWDAPGLFWLNHSDMFLSVCGWAGVVLSLLALTGISEKKNEWVSAAVWLMLWILYLSFVNAGQTFYGFGWESILLETGFLAIFLGSKKSAVPVLVIWLLRWVLFRVMFGAGLIKLRGDPCWLDLTCMAYHYETQPIPNPLSWYFHHLPMWFHKAEVMFTHFVELIVPWGYFLPGMIGVVAGILTVSFQFILILSGNLSWLNYMTIVLCIPCFDDSFLRRIIRCKEIETGALGKPRKGLVILLTCFVLWLSAAPVNNMISPGQRMNASFNSLHLVNTYGAFGSVTKKRNEVIFLGTADDVLGPSTEWKEYEFKCKPGDIRRRPCVVSPYHLRLDWQIWFAAMTNYTQHSWLLNLVSKLLQGNQKTLQLLAGDPFAGDRPKYVRADLYEYRFSSDAEKKASGQWWVRKRLGEYLPPLSLEDPAFKRILKGQGWM